MRSLGAAVLLVSLAACGSSAPAPPPSSAPTRSTATGDSSLDAIATEARTRDVCGDANEALLRRLVPDLFACATEVRLAYVIARTSAGTVLAIAGWQPRGEGHSEPLALRAVLVDGRAVDALPAGVPRSDVDRRALFLAAVLVETQDPRVALDGPNAMALVPAAARIYLQGRLASDEDAQHAFVLVAEDGGEAPEDVLLRRRRVSIDAAGQLVVDDRAELVLRNWRSGQVCAPHLETLAQTAPLETVATPRVLCGDAGEAAVRMRMPALPACDRIADAHYLVAHAVSEPSSTEPSHPTEMIAVVWGLERDQRSVFDEGCITPDLGSAFVHDADDQHAMLEAAILMHCGGTDYATSVAAIPASVPRTVRARLSRVSFASPSGELIAVSWPEAQGDPMLRYRARYDEYRMFPVYVYELDPHDGEQLVDDPYEDVPMGALDGL